MSMLSVSVDVTFRVLAKTRPNEVVCIVGDCPILGDWDPHHAIVMKQQTNKGNQSDSDTQSCSQQCSEDGDIWSKKLVLDGFITVQYRYFIGRIYESDIEGDSRRHVHVRWWEGHIKPRTFSPHDAVVLYQKQEVPEPDQFGCYDGVQLINWGWLTDNVEVQLQMHSNPISMWKHKYRNQIYSIKCTPLDHRYKDSVDDYDQEIHGDSVPICGQTECLVSVLEKDRSKPVPQTSYGAIYKPDNFMTFHASTFDPENLGFQLDLFVHDSLNNGGNSETEPRHVGFAFILPLEMNKSRGSKKIPVTGFNHKPIGHLKFDYFLVKPFVTASFSMRRTFQRYWKSTRRPVDVGHRGLGVSYKLNKLVPVRENTVRSLQSAAQHGADFVEFDVQLTKDEVPVIYHDFKVLLTYRKKRREDLELFEIPVKELRLDELQHMKLSHPAYQPEHKYVDIQEDDQDPEDLQPFPTLKAVFEGVDIHTGFNIEIKYPLIKVDGSGFINDYFDHNKYVDTILKCVFENHGGRRIIFSAFDPDICTLLRQKQNVYPVLFLTNGDTTRYIRYADPRAHTVQIATELALSSGLLGVDVVSDVIIKDMSLIKYVKDAGLVLFVWGEGCNDKDTIKRFKENKVDGVIYDRIDFYKTDTKESIFKIEEKQKKHMLVRIGSITLEDSPDSSNDSP